MRSGILPWRAIVAAVVGITAGPGGVVAFGQTTVGGRIGADTTWTLAASPYLATETVELIGGAVLTIEPGVEVAFEAGTSLDARLGVLIADGQGGDAIVLRSASGAAGGWQGVLTSADEPSVVTAEGAYVGGPIFRGVRITEATVAVRAGDQPLYFEAVTIEGNSSRGVQFSGSTPDATTWLKGVTIRDSGIGLSSFSDAGRFVLRDCVFEDNTSSGVVLREGSGELVRCVFRRNGLVDVTFGGGGAMLRGSWQVRECVFEANRAVRTATGGGGGGLLLEGNASTIVDCEFISNVASGPGGGAAIWALFRGANVLVEGCRFIANTSQTSSGGGVLAGASTGSQLVLDIRGCTFEDNQGDSNGGLVVGNVTGRVVDNVFRNNTGGTSGGAMRIFNEVHDLVVRDNDFTDNATQAGGGAIDLAQLFRGTSLRIEGNSFQGNSADRGGAIAGVGRVETSASGNAFEGNAARLGGAIEIRPDAADVLLALAGPPGNRFAANLADLGAAIYNGSTLAVDAAGNCWGTSDPAAIAARIYDRADDPTRGAVAFDPIATDCDDCPADLDGDGSLTIFDFLAFGNLFDDQDPRADFDGDGQFTIFDFLAFQNAFDSGCP